MSITKITSDTELASFLTDNENCCVHWTLDDADDARTKELLTSLNTELQKTASTYPDIKFATIDLESNEKLAEDQKIRALSCFKFYQKSEPKYKFSCIEIDEVNKHCDSLKDPSLESVSTIYGVENFNKMLKDNQFVVVDFTALWCGPCRMIGPVFEKLAEKQKSDGKNIAGTEELIKFCKVDADDNEEIKKQAEIKCFPTFQFYKDGEKVETLEGADEDELKTKIGKLVKPDFEIVHNAKMIDTKEAFDELVKNTKIVVVDFTASWCGPCQMIKPIYEELATEHKDNADIELIKVDVDENDETAKACEVRSMPTFHIYVNGEKKESWSGANPAKLKEKIAEALAEWIKIV